MHFRRIVLAALCALPVTAFAAGHPGWVKIELRGRGGEAVSDGVSRAVARAAGGEKIRDYEAFSLIRVPEARRGSVAAAAASHGVRPIEHEEWDRVLLPGGVSVDTRAPQAPASGRISSYPQGRGLYVVQFDGPLSDSDSDKLAAFGLKYLGYVPYNAALVVGSQAQVDRLAKEPGVQWTSIYHTAYRARPAFVQEPGSDDEYIVQVANVEGKDAIVDFIRRSSRRKIDVSDVGPYLNVYAQVSADTAEQFIAEPLVVAIEKREQTMLSGEREAISVTNLNAQLYANDPYQDGVQPSSSVRRTTARGSRTAACSTRAATASRSPTRDWTATTPRSVRITPTSAARTSSGRAMSRTSAPMIRTAMARWSPASPSAIPPRRSAPT